MVSCVKVMILNQCENVYRNTCQREFILLFEAFDLNVILKVSKKLFRISK